MARRRYTKKESEAAFTVLLVVILAILAALVSLWNFLVETKLIWLVPIAIVGIVAFRVWSSRKRAAQQAAREAARKEAWQAAEAARKEAVMAHQSEWGDVTCQTILERDIDLGMTEEMVRLAWGEPTTTEMKEVTVKGSKTRWIYGVPRKGARYIWFTNGEVSRIRQ